MDAETKQKWEILGEEYPEVVERLSQKLGLAQVVLSRSSETSKDQKMVKRFLPDEIEVSDPYWFEEGVVSRFRPWCGK